MVRCREYSPATKLAVLILACANGIRKADIPQMLVDDGHPRVSLATVYNWTRRQRATARTAREQRLDSFVAVFVERLGHNFGARQLQHAAREELGRRVSKRELVESMRRVNPWAHRQRRDFADARRTRGTLDHVLTEGEWWQTDMDCKLQDYGLYVGGTIDVATRFLYNIVVVSFKSVATVWREVHEPPLREYGLPRKYTMDKGSENWMLGFAVMSTDSMYGGHGEAKMRFVQSKRNVRSASAGIQTRAPLPCMPLAHANLVRAHTRSHLVVLRISCWQSSAFGAT